MSITITVVGETIVEIYSKLGAKAASFASDKDLIEELRTRMRPQGLVVNVDPAPEPAPDDEASEETESSVAREARAGLAETEAAPDKPKRGRPRKDATPPPESGKTAPRETADATVTRDDVIAALNAFSTARGGQVAGRQIMQDVTGATKLVEVKPEDYAKLVAALKV